MIPDDIREAISSEPVTIEVTTECNSDCAHCFVKKNSPRPHHLSFQEAISIIQDSFNTGFRKLHITGGEPFQWKGIVNLFEESINIGYEEIFVNTNGSLLDEKVCRQIKKLNRDIKLSVSLQGKEETHNLFRNSGAFGPGISGLRHAFDAGIPVLLFSTTGKSLLRELTGFTEFCYGSFPNISGITLIQLINVFKESPSMKRELLSPEEFISLVQTSNFLNLYGYRVNILENPLSNVVSSIRGFDNHIYSPPLHRPGRIAILADKKITPAHSTGESFVSYKPGILKDVLSSAEYRNAVSPDRERCPGCRYHDICTSNGMARPSEDYRDMDRLTPYCRRVLDIAVKENRLNSKSP